MSIALVALVGLVLALLARTEKRVRPQHASRLRRTA